MSADYVVDDVVRWSFVDDVTGPLNRVKQALAEANSLINGSVSPTKGLEEAYKMLGTSGTESVKKVTTDIKSLNSEMNILPKDTKLEIKANAAEAINNTKDVTKNVKTIPRETLLKIKANATEAINNTKDITKNVKTIPKETLLKINAETDAKKILDFKKEAKEVPKNVNVNLRLIDHVSDPVKQVNTATKETEKSTSRLKDVLTGTFAGSIISNGITSLGNQIINSAKDGLELAEAGEQTQRAWSAMGVPKSQIQGLSNNMVELRNETGFAAGNIKDIQKQFFGFTNSVDLTANLTKGVTALAVASGKGVEGAESITSSFKRVESQGKLTNMAFTRMTAAVPALPKELASALNMSQDQLKKSVAAGNISADEFINAVAKIGTNSQQTFKDFGKTGEGVMSQIKGGWIGVKSTLMQPLVDTKTSGLESVRDLLQSKDMTTLAHSVGEGLSYMAEQAAKFVKYISEHQKDINGIIDALSKILSILAKSIWSTISEIIKDIAKAFGLISDSANKSNDPLKKVESALNAVASHKAAIEALGKVLVAAFAVKKISGFAKEIQTINANLKVTKGLQALGKPITEFVSTLKESKSVISAFGAALKAVPFTLWITAIAAVILALTELYKHNKKFREFVNGIIDAVKGAYKEIAKWLDDAIKGVRGFFEGIQGFFKDVQKNINTFNKDIGKNTNNFIKTAQQGFAGFGKSIGNIWNNIEKQWQKSWNSINKWFSKFWKDISKQWRSDWNGLDKWFNKSLNSLSKNWDNTWNSINKYFSGVWQGISKFWQGIWNPLVKWFDNTLNGISRTWNNVWRSISNFFIDIWNGMNKFVHPIFSGIASWISDVLRGISNTWNHMWQSMADFFSNIWNGIKHAAQDGINGVLSVINAGVDAIDTVWKFFTGHKTSIRHLQPVKLERGGVVHTRLTMINDGAGQNWKELLQLPNGDLKMSHERNAILPLPVGTRVYNGAETAAIMHSAGVERYAKGGIVGNVLDWTKGKLSDIGSWIGDKADAVDKFLKNPLGNISKLLHNATDGLFHGAESFGQLASGVIDKLAEISVDKFKEMLKKVKDEIESQNVNGPAGPKVGRWRSVIEQAAKILNHAPLAGWQINNLLSQIATESGGDNNIVQSVWDRNMASGNPAQGLLQFIPSTFGQWAIPGHRNIKSGLDQLIAAIRRLDAMGTWNYIGHGHGWWSGGHLIKPQIATLAEHGDEFVVNPRMTNAPQLINEAYERTLQEQPHLRDATSPNVKNNSTLDFSTLQSSNRNNSISNKMLNVIIERLTEIRDKDTDMYLDGEKVTKTTEKISAGRFRIAQSQGQA